MGEDIGLSTKIKINRIVAHVDIIICQMDQTDAGSQKK